MDLKATNWNRQLPAHIAKNEAIWWEVFPRIQFDIPPRTLRFLLPPGTAKETPSREIVGRVTLIAETKDELEKLFGDKGGHGLLNCWGCHSHKKLDGQDMVYMSGTADIPRLVFTVPRFSPLSGAFLAFVAKSNPTEFMVHGAANAFVEIGKLLESEAVRVSVLRFERGPWENGLDIAFKAAIWFNSNPREALANIWEVGM